MIDFKGILKAMEGKPVTIRLLAPPLHEFITLNDEQIIELASSIGIDESSVKQRITSHHELNPMLGHRGCRLGIAYPEITEMQAKAILEAAAELTSEKVETFPEIMIPLTGMETEYYHQEKIVRDVAAKVDGLGNYMVGTMMEIPCASIVADRIA